MHGTLVPNKNWNKGWNQ